jgi:hypothetical protein
MRTTVAHEWQSSANAGAGYWTVIIAETQCSSATVRLYLTLHGQRAPVKSPRPAELQKKTDLSQERDANAACGSRSVDEESLTALVLLSTSQSTSVPSIAPKPFCNASLDPLPARRIRPEALAVVLHRTVEPV